MRIAGIKPLQALASAVSRWIDGAIARVNKHPFLRHKLNGDWI